MLLEEKICVVTGGGVGMGRATALTMAREGARVVIADIDDDAGAETLRLLEEQGGEGLYVHCDVSSSDEVQALMRAAAERFGGIDVLHNNAGVNDALFTDRLKIHELDEKVWDTVHGINLRGSWLCTKYAAPHLLASTRGPSIVNVASVGAQVAYPQAPAYCVSKGGILQLTRMTAVDLGPTVRCNCYSPSVIATPMLERYIATSDDPPAMERALVAAQVIPRLGDPFEVAELVCFLASDRARFLTGAMVPIDGGTMAWRGSNA